MKKNVIKTIIFICTIISFSCGKKFLEIKDNSSLRIPNKIADYQGIIDEYTTLNNKFPIELAVMGGDEYFVTESAWNSLSSLTQKNAYIWAKDVFMGEYSNDWENGYHAILLANMALEIKNIIPAQNETHDWNNVKGSALFYRAFYHFALAQLFCKPYNKNSASEDLGIPLRLDSDISTRSKRSTLAETYNQVINDLMEAVPLLPDKPIVVYRPSKAAAFALLARIYLIMGNYHEALKYSELSLAIKNELIDFNEWNLNDTYLMTANWETDNPELIIAFLTPSPAILAPASRQNVSTTLFELYDSIDLRKEAFFRIQSGRLIYKGSYTRGGFFGGIAVNECYLIKAECLARLGDEVNAIHTINELSKKRYQKNSFVPFQGISGLELLKLILLERRKELAFTGHRWFDLRRLNNDPRFSETLQRVIGNNVYVLTPDDPRYVWPIPDNEIDLSGIEQNKR